RPVREAEHQEVADLMVTTYAQVLGEYLDDEYRAELSDVARRAREAVVLVAVDAQDTLLGSITYVPGPGYYAEFDGVDEAGVRMLVVDPAAQGRGVGEALVRACVEQARADSRRRLTLHTTPSMAAARRLYERLGFQRAPEGDETLPDGLVLLGYALDL
ncbi:MAG: GNAT family N-acetyltransferase, partial [Actinobacteria bacterium]|nr:GNAT family N-acetyltransferase [Actinomycetota bacterium]